MIITFFGHRDFQKKDVYRERLFAILKSIINKGPVTFYLGGYGQFDHFAYECAKEIKRNDPQTELVLVTPYITADYQKKHLEPQKLRFDSILYPPLEGVPLKFAISRRNHFMVDKADLIIVYIDHSFGGAYQAYQYAKRKGKVIFNLANIPSKSINAL